jgi:GTP cyclohydrolase II
MRKPTRSKRQKSISPPAKVKPVRRSGGDNLTAVARGADALKAGRPVLLGGGWAMLAAETLKPAQLKRLSHAFLALTHARARTLKIRLYTPDVVALALDGRADPAAIAAIADPTRDMATPLKGPFEAVRRKLPQVFPAAVKLAKLAGLLPAAVLFKAKTGAVRLDPVDIFAYEAAAAANLELAARAKVPLEGAEDAELAAFRSGDGGPENYALIIGHPPTDMPVLTRLHSECFTGDLLGSLKCDCGQQLRGAIKTISRHGGGILLYLAQEGRGIGLVNKLRAYQLQDQGFDTVEANQRLGFEPDERIYSVAANMLKLLGFSSVRLLTNNPAKVAGLQDAGIEVAERVRHAFPANPHNLRYLRTKAEKAGHLL